MVRLKIKGEAIEINKCIAIMDIVVERIGGSSTSARVHIHAIDIDRNEVLNKCVETNRVLKIITKGHILTVVSKYDTVVSGTCSYITAKRVLIPKDNKVLDWNGVDGYKVVLSDCVKINTRNNYGMRKFCLARAMKARNINGALKEKLYKGDSDVISIESSSYDYLSTLRIIGNPEAFVTVDVNSAERFVGLDDDDTSVGKSCYVSGNWGLYSKF